jgi:transcriptional regulator NrdR family protein
MKCPECTYTMKTKDTRQWRDENREFYWVERRRVCPSCDHRLMTIEMPKDIWLKYTEGQG